MNCELLPGNRSFVLCQEILGGAVPDLDHLSEALFEDGIEILV